MRISRSVPSRGNMDHNNEKEVFSGRAQSAGLFSCQVAPPTLVQARHGSHFLPWQRRIYIAQAVPVRGVHGEGAWPGSFRSSGGRWRGETGRATSAGTRLCCWAASRGPNTKCCWRAKALPFPQKIHNVVSSLLASTSLFTSEFLFFALSSNPPGFSHLPTVGPEGGGSHSPAV